MSDRLQSQIGELTGLDVASKPMALSEPAAGKEASFDSTMLWLWGGYMWLSIHRPFEVWPWLAMSHLERVYFVICAMYWFFRGSKYLSLNRLSVALLAFYVVFATSWLVSPFRAATIETADSYTKQLLFAALLLASLRGAQAAKRVLWLWMGSMSLYLLHSLREFINGRHVYRMGTVRMIGVDSTMSDPNSFAATIVLCLPLVWILWRHTSRRWVRVVLAGYAVLSIACILLTGSRSGLVGLLALLLGFALKSRHRLRVVVVLLCMMLGTWGLLREDLRNRYLTLIDPSAGPAGARQSAEGREQGLLDGIALWEQRPLLGWGPGAHGLATRRGSQAHNLYGQVLGETGTLGALAFLFVLYGFFYNLREAGCLFRIRPTSANGFSYDLCKTMAVVTLLLLLLGWGGHNLYRYTWLWCGAIGAAALADLRLSVTSDAPESDRGVLP